MSQTRQTNRHAITVMNATREELVDYMRLFYPEMSRWLVFSSTTQMREFIKLDDRIQFKNWHKEWTI